MKLPWQNQTGLAKLAAILATILLVALGLCGANFVAVMKFVPFDGTSRETPLWVSQGLMLTAFFELFFMGLSTLGLVVIAIIAIARAIKNHFTYD